MAPEDLPSFSYNGQPGCSLQYDETTRILTIVVVVDDDDGGQEEGGRSTTILDVIDTDDMIGARIEIEMKETASTSTTKTTMTKSIDKDGRDDNEPPTDVLSDGQGSTTVVIFVYPRRSVSSSSSSWSAWLGLSTSTAAAAFAAPTNNAKPSSSEKKLRHRGPPRVAQHRTLQLAPSEDFAAARRLVAWLRTIIAEAPGGQQQQQETSTTTTRTRTATTDTTNTASTITTAAPKRYWIIVNPMAGPKKNAAMLAQTIIVPMLEQANIDCTVLETTHARHGQSLFKETDGDVIRAYDALVLLGGDGILHEVLNGIRERPDADQLLRHFSILPIGIVGCGTSNGLATSLTHAAGEATGVLHDTFLIAKGRTVAADVAVYQIDSSGGINDDDDGSTAITKYTSFLTFTWAMIADVDIDSECLRFLGESRYDVWAVYRTLFLRSYKATLGYTMEADKNLKVTDPMPSSWTVIEADFVLFWASQVTHPGKSTFLCPSLTFGNGTITIMMVRAPVSRWKMVRILLSLETGSHTTLPGVEWVTCRQFRLVPARHDVSYNDLDGEEVVRGPVQAMVEPKQLRYLGHGGGR